MFSIRYHNIKFIYLVFDGQGPVSAMVMGARRMKTWLVLLSTFVAVMTGCGGSTTSPSSEVSPPALPDLSAPQRFRPWVDQLSVSPATIKVGDDTVVTASVHSRAGMPSPDVSWILFAEPTSVGNGVLSELSGLGQLRSELRANYPGEVSLVAYAIESNGVPSMPTRVVVTVVP